ncbi:adenylate kinase [Labrenzia sp. R4_2]|uniref:adenylate kinase n=1 Tax=Labrenzia sp. R4_2 TaxID=2821107 RepID=UPI001ADB349C|nr:adenylate kinase [Labrenzia sp. R4_2]MBO9420306.1 adenylate kinase [Labrenzia sp. R4_2]
MSRIAILGNTAGGKSTLARHLAKTRCLPHIEIDEIYWLPKWTAVPSQIYEKDHDAAIEMPEWIIDGGGDLASVRKRVARATELILLDFTLWIHFWRAAERQMAWANGTLQHPPGGGQEMPPTGRLFEIIWDVDREWMPVLRKLCDDNEALGKSVVRLTSLDDLEAFSTNG